jgi:transposase
MAFVKGRGNTSLVEFSMPLTREEAEAIYAQGREAVIFVLMQLAARLAESSPPENSTGPSTPSGMVPVYEKPTVRRRRKKPGAKPGHPGARRQAPSQITRREEHPPLQSCPECGSTLGEVAERRFRLIEDIPDSQPEVTEHSIPRHWCARCRKFVEPPIPDAMPGARFGHRMVTLSAWLHYGLGVTISQVRSVLGQHLHFRLSEGGISDAWRRLANVLVPWYDQIGHQVKRSGVLHGDETGWRVNGQTQWLWCFSTKEATYYMIDRSRGSPALSKFFTEAFDGVLVTDFWSAYNAVVSTARQACLTHLFRELDKVSERDDSRLWKAFSKKLGRLLRDAIRLSQRDALSEEQYASRRARIHKRLDVLPKGQWHNPNAQRLLGRLKRYRDALFTFLDHPEVPSDNNHAEREIRPAVIMRKNSLCNRSQQGANVQAIMMSVYRTLKLRGLDPLDTIVRALRQYLSTGVLPPLPPENRSDG